MRINLQPAFILHRRPFRDTSLLLDCFTVDYGRVRLIARNARGVHSRFRGLLEPFVPFLLSWSGKTELVTLQKAEAQGVPYLLTGSCLIHGFYLNELLLRLLPYQDAHPGLYSTYQATLAALVQQTKVEPYLRLFEKQLVWELGYGISLQQDREGNTMRAEEWYYFSPEYGISLSAFQTNQHMLFWGKHLIALQEGTLQAPEELQTAKRFMRLLLAPLLGNKPIKTRELWL